MIIHGVNKSPGLASSYLELLLTALAAMDETVFRPVFRRLLHGFWESPGFSPGSYGVADRSAASRISAQIHRLFICRLAL